jgi:hypothetical protein
MELRPLARALISTSGRAVAARAVPLACASAIGAAIVFAPQGLRTRDVVALSDGSAGFRVGLFATWVVLATPAAAAAFGAPGTVMLRSLRPPRPFFAMLAVLLALAEAPWIALFARGGGVSRGALAALLAVAGTASASALRSRRGLSLFAATMALVVVRPPAAVALPAAAALAWLAVRVAWSEAVEARPGVRMVRRSPPALALASAYVAATMRGAQARVRAAAVVVLGAGGALALTLRNDPDARPLPRTLVVLAFPLAVACALLAAPAIETEKRLAPLLRSLRVPAATLALATALALAAPSSAFAATAGAVACAASHGPVSVALAAWLWALPIAASVALWARRASRARRPSTFVLGVLVIATLFTLVPASC